MLRILLTYVLPLVLPSLVFLVWVRFAPRRKTEGEEGERIEIPWLWLAGAGVLLAGISLGAMGLHDRAPPDAVYEPARLGQDGKIQHSPAGR